MCMNSSAVLHASECVEDMRLGSSAAEFGYKVQALAAHVLLRLNYQVTAINQVGHPDVVAISDMQEFRFEVEAEVGGPRPRQLTDEDLASLIDPSGAVGYFALAVSFPSPRWILVPAKRLQARNPSSNVLLESLSDRSFSDAWTLEYLNLLSSECQRIRRTSFATLCARALAGRGL